MLLDVQDEELDSNKHEAELYLQRLKDAVYDADDLLDELLTLAEQKRQIEGGKASEKLRRFFSSSNPFLAAHKMSQEVKKIREKLDTVASNHTKFGFSVDSQPIRRRREETCSYVYEGSIVGREDEVKKIVGLLLGDSNIRLLELVGWEKLPLAQLMFNDARVTSAFPLRLWTCVFDHDREHLDLEGILHKILSLIMIMIGKKDEELTMDQVQKQLREKLASNRYVLIVDDVWTENRNQWQKLIELLLEGQKGSWIVVTTRSHETTTIIGCG